MEYALGTVIVLSLVYLTIVLKKYTKVAEANQPKVKDLQERIRKLRDGLESETKLSKTARLRVEDAKVAVSDTKMEIATVEKRIGDEKRREEQLEIGRYKKEFKRKG